MKILHVVASYLPAVRYGGTITSTHGLCRALAARGHDVHVFTTSVDGARDSDVPHGQPVDRDGVKVWYFRSTWLRRVYWAPAMNRALSAQVSTVDLVHSHSVFLWPMWAAARAARRAGVPYVISPRGTLEKALIAKKSRWLKTAWIALIERQNLECAAAIHVTSRREADEMLAFGFNLPPLREVPNGIDLDAPVARDAISPAIAGLVNAGPFLLFLGRLNWKKGLDRLIAAMASAPSVTLVIAGNDEERYQSELESLAAAAGVTGRVHFAGPVRGGDKAALLDRCDALVLPSYSENFGNVVVEAMAAGRPVILTPEVGLSDAVRAAGAGWVVEGDPPTLGARIAELMANARLRQDMGERGRRLVVQSFTWGVAAERMEALYRDILDARRPA